jgi:PAS domain S-box-containing protein
MQREIDLLRRQVEGLKAEVSTLQQKLSAFQQEGDVFHEADASVDAETPLRVREERLRIANEAARIGTYTANLEKDRVYWSPELCDILGVPPGSPRTNEEAYNVVHVDDRERVLATGKRASEDPGGNGRFYSEHRIVRSDGQVRWVLWRGRTLFRQTDSGKVPSKRIGACIDITDRKRAEEELRESEERHRKIVEFSTDAILVRSGDVIIYANPAAVSLFRARHAGELVGQSYLSLVHPDDRPESIERISKGTTEKWIAPPREHRVLALDGQVVHVESTGVPVQHRGETQLFGVFRDITGRKRAEEALRESEEIFNAFMEHCPVYVFFKDEKIRPVRLSRNFEQMLGRPIEEVLGKTMEELFPEDLAKGMVADDLAVINGGRSIKVVEVFNGRTFETTKFPIQQSGKPNMLAGFTIDITERKRAEDEIRKQKEILQKIFDHLPVMVNFIGKDGEIELVNREWERTLGWTLEELQKNRVDVFAECYPDPDYFRYVKEFLSSSETVKADLKTRVRDGRLIDTNWSMIRLSDGTTIGIGQDISERKRAGQQREKLEAQLRQAQKMEAIGTLAGGIAHDFNNILSVIIGNAEILQMTDLSFSGKDEVDQILTAAKRAKDLVRQILAFSRQGEQQKLLMSLKPVVKETIEFLRASIPSTIQLQHYLKPDSGTIMADPTQMQQVLMNLCTNAAHAMEKEGGELKIELDTATVGDEEGGIGPEAEQGEYVRLTVSDTGHGIEPGLLPRIFDPYFSTKGPDKGTGLGLSVVHGIVKSHGGIVKVFSEVGKGSVFHVLFPRADGVVKKDEKAQPQLPIGVERILVVDDEKHLVEMYRRMLGLLGYYVDGRTSPVEAIEALRSNPAKYDLLLTDMTMPQMNGYQLAKKVMDISPKMPVILCTGFSDQINEEKARSVGIWAFLLKPVLFQDLANTLRNVLDASKADREKTSTAQGY